MFLFKKVLLKTKFISLDILWSIKLLLYYYKYRIHFKKYTYIDKTVLIKINNSSQFIVNGPLRLAQYSELIIVNEKGRINFGNVTTRSFCRFRIENGHLKIGENVFFNNNCSINCFEEIEIGNNVIFGESVKVYDHNHKINFTNGSITVFNNEFTVGKIIIGDNTWISSNVTILKGVQIGKNCVIGAGCIIHKSIPDNSIVKAVQNHNLEIIS
jgi:acetyltransferase-like isoleucine patch superfamily enzyme